MNRELPKEIHNRRSALRKGIPQHKRRQDDRKNFLCKRHHFHCKQFPKLFVNLSSRILEPPLEWYMLKDGDEPSWNATDLSTHPAYNAYTVSLPSSTTLDQIPYSPLESFLSLPPKSIQTQLGKRRQSDGASLQNERTSPGRQLWQEGGRQRRNQLWMIGSWWLNLGMNIVIIWLSA